MCQSANKFSFFFFIKLGKICFGSCVQLRSHCNEKFLWKISDHKSVLLFIIPDIHVYCCSICIAYVYCSSFKNCLKIDQQQGFTSIFVFQVAPRWIWFTWIVVYMRYMSCTVICYYWLDIRLLQQMFGKTFTAYVWEMFSSLIHQMCS